MYDGLIIDRSAVAADQPASSTFRSLKLTRSDGAASSNAPEKAAVKPKKAKSGEVDWVAKGEAKVKATTSCLTDLRILRTSIDKAQLNPETRKPPGII